MGKSGRLAPEKPLDRLLSAVEGAPRPVLVAVGLVMVYLTGYLDYLSGMDISPQILYLIPIGLVSWCAGRNEGYLIAVNAGVARLIADWVDLRGDKLGFVPQWNAGSFYVIGMTFAHLLASLRMRLDHEQELARTDSLTGIRNKRSFIESAETEIERARRRRYSFAVAYVDCDNFKQVNDHLGHTAGDELLQCVARTMKSSARPFDLVARLGGDEFVVLLPEVSAPQSLAALERVQEALMKAVRERAWPVTFSIGIANFETPPATVTEMLRLADDVMYLAKRAGKNRITQATLPLPPHALQDAELDEEPPPMPDSRDEFVGLETPLLPQAETS